MLNEQTTFLHFIFERKKKQINCCIYYYRVSYIKLFVDCDKAIVTVSYEFQIHTIY